MKKQLYKQIPELKTEQEYAGFWNSVSDATEYLNPKRFKSVSSESVLPIVPSISEQVSEVKKIARRTGTKAEILLYRLLQAGLHSLSDKYSSR